MFFLKRFKFLKYFKNQTQFLIAQVFRFFILYFAENVLYLKRKYFQFFRVSNYFFIFIFLGKFCLNFCYGMTSSLVRVD